jgi:F0F1-type ATP synthase membrane subunit c/vacuolar-type H+-ATPase subunit K
MRVNSGVRFACGVAVLLTTLGYAHLAQHFLGHAASHRGWLNPVFVAGLVFAIAVGILSLIGGFLLLDRRR